MTVLRPQTTHGAPGANDGKHDRTTVIGDSLATGHIASPAGLNATQALTVDPVLEYGTFQAPATLDGSLTLSDGGGNVHRAIVQITGNYRPGEDVLSWTPVGHIHGHFNPRTGTLELHGGGTAAEYEQVLRSVAYTDKLASPSLDPRTITITVQDAHHPGLRDVGTVKVLFAGPPHVATSGTPVSITEGNPAVTLEAGLTLTDIDDPNMASATVHIATGLDAGDTLLFTGTAHITGSYDAATGTLTLSGSAPIAEYQAALQSVQFQSTSDDPTATKTVTWVVNDGTDNSTPVTTTIHVTPVNDAPTLGIGATLAYTENGAPAVITSAATLGDVDSADCNGGSLTVHFSANGAAEDQLTILNAGTGAGQIGISGSSVTYGGIVIGTWSGGTNGSDLVIDFTSSAATPAAVQALVNDIAYGNSSDNPSTLTRTVSYTLVDGDGTANGGHDTATATANVVVAAVNDAPTVTASSGNAMWTEAGPPSAIDPSIVLADPDNATLAGATVTITGDDLSGHDVLAFAPVGNITSSFDTATGVLTLSGKDTLAHYQAALASVTFDSDSDSPGASRTISFAVSDGNATSNVATRSITITEVNSSPVVSTSGGSAVFVENGSAVVDGALVVSDADTPTLAGATVQIGTGFHAGQDALSFTALGNITGSYNATTGTLTLSGTDTLADYQAALDSVTYVNSSDAPDTTTRTIEFQVDDGQGVNNLSTVATRTVTVTASNDPPVVTIGSTLAYTENDPATVIASGAVVTDPDSGNFDGGTLTVHFSANGAAEDQLAILNAGTGAGQIGISGSSVTYGGIVIGTWSGGANGSDLVVALTGSAATPAAVQELVRDIAYANTSDHPSGAARTVTFTLVDGDGGSDTGTGSATIDVTPVNDPPVLAGAGATAIAYTENDPATVIDGGITIGDVDGTTLTSATVRISANFQSNQDVLAFTPTGNISGSFDASTGVLTLSGTDTLAHYQSALDSVTYQNTSDNPDAATRTVTFDVDDGSGANGTSNTISHDIGITPVNDPPVVVAGGTLAYTENQAATVINGGITVSDAEGDGITGATVTISGNYQNGQDVLSFTPTGSITGSFNAATGTLTLSGADTAAHYQAALDSVSYLNTSDNPSTAARTISFAATDSHGDTGTIATSTISVAAVNDAPVNTVPADSAVGTAFSNTPLAISGVSIADVDAGSGTMTVHIQNDHGGMSVSLAGGAAVSAGSNGSGDFTLSGTAAQLNAALSTLSFKSTDGFTGANTVTITTSDAGNTGGGAMSDTDTFHIGVVPQVFIVDNTDSTADAAGAGTSANPFNSIASLNSAGAVGAGDYVYINHGTGTYSEAAGLTLQNNEQVYGQGQTLTFINPVTGETVTVGTGTAGNAPTLSITGAGATGVTLAQGNTLTGFNIATTLGSQTGITDGNGSVGSLTVNNMNVTGTGMAVDIDQGGSLNVSLGTLSSSGSTQQGVQLAGTGTNALTGTFSASAGAISGSTGTGFLVGDGSGTAGTGGAAVISYGGTISTAGTARALDIEDRTSSAGSVTFSGSISHSGGNANGVFIQDIAGGAITVSGNGTFSTGTAAAIQASNVTGGSLTFSGTQSITTTSGAGISLTGNSAAASFTGAAIGITTGTGAGVSVSGNSGSVSFSTGTGAGLDVTTSGGTGITASSSGTLTIQGSGNSISVTNGTAISIANTTIGSSGLNFHAISSTGGVNGIVLNNTGSGGSLTVTGDGSTAGSGGTISGTSGDAVSVTGGSFNLAFMKIQNSGGHGINATNLVGSSSYNNGTISGWDTGSTFTKNGINWVNTGANAGSLTVSHSTLSSAAGGNEGIFVEAQGSGTMTLTVDTSTFSGLYGDAIHVDGIGGATSQQHVTIANSSFTNAVAGTGNGGVSLDPFGSVTLYADVNNNTFSNVMNAVSNMGAITVSNGQQADAEVTIRNNTISNIAGARGITVFADGGTNNYLIDHNTIDNLGSSSKAAISVTFNNNTTLGTTGNGSVTVSNNQIGEHGSNPGILWTSTAAANADAISLGAVNGATMTSAITGNTVAANTNFEDAIAYATLGGKQNVTVSGNNFTDTAGTHVEFTAQAGSSSTVNLSMSGNVLPGSGVGVIDLLNSGTMHVTQASASAVSSVNSSATVTVGGSTAPVYGAAAPSSPSTPALPLLVHATGGTAQPITSDQLAFIVNAAAARWEQLPLTADQLHALTSLKFTLGNLGAGQIGAESPGLIVLDATAGGQGWFVDSTPMSDSEFTSVGGSPTLLQATDPAAAGHMDLLTAVMHEMGHALGLSDLYGAENQGDVMDGYLTAGERVLPAEHDVQVTVVGVANAGPVA